MTRRRLDAAEYTVGWICALPVELAAAQVMLDEEHQTHEGLDSTQYTLGCIGSHNVVLACLPAGQMGIGPAAFSASQTMSKFTSIRFGLMVGVGGGAPNAEADVRLGDVVVSQPMKQLSGVVQYDFGKTGAGGQMMRTGSLNAPPRVLLHAVAQLRALRYRDSQERGSLVAHLSTFEQRPYFSRDKAGPDVLFKAAYLHDGGATCERCSKDHIVPRTARRADEEVTIHYGTIASGNQVIKDAETRDRLSKELGGVLCFEMEAAGLMNDFPCLVIRGICDYADSHKNKAWQPYAAATAAACAKTILSLVPVAEAGTTAAVSRACKYRVPFSLKTVPVGKFAERPRDTEALEQVLVPQRNVKARRLLAAHGLGGVGKTQLAANFARRHQSCFSSVLWLDGSTKSKLEQSFVTFASRIPVGQISEASRLYAASQGGNIATVVKDVLGWLSEVDNSEWLLIIDNVDRDHRQHEDIEAYDIEEYLPEADHGSVLITTRLQYLGQLDEAWEVRKVNKEQSQAIFETWYGKSVGQEADELLERLDGLPLALAQAAAYIKETGMSFETYTRLYKDQWQKLMKSDDSRGMPLRNYANGSVATTWTITYTAIREENQAAANLLLLWAHLDNKDMWHGLLTDASEWSPEAAENTSAWLRGMARNEIEFIEAIKTLRSYSLVNEAEDRASYSTHPVVHQWALHVQDESQQIALSRLAIVLVGLAAPGQYEDKSWKTMARLLPHVAQCEKNAMREDLFEEKVDSAQERPMLPWAVHNLGDLQKAYGNFNKAEKLYVRALEGHRKEVGEDHRLTLATKNDLGMLYRRQGKLGKAEEMYNQALEGFRKTLGEEHFSTINTFGNLANLYSKQGRLNEAEEMYLLALKYKRKTLGDDNMSTIETLNNLGVLYNNQDRRDEAEQTFEQVIEGGKRALGDDHPSVLEMVFNLGGVYALQHKSDQAEEMYIQALEGNMKTLGENHLSTLHVVSALGTFYLEQGKIEEAEKMSTQALKGFEEIMGPEGTSTFLPALISMVTLGRLLPLQGRMTDAQAFLAKALSGFEKVYGIEDPKFQNLRVVATSLDKIVEEYGENPLDEASNVGSEEVHDHTLPVPTSGWHRVLTYLGLK
ncbi:hypothetical protein OPT61_g6869 [Boeremia exigua]|uniref:Uncharacterized protein n=1 Tax=Boeremia exigua TaxID=749465 RepID=A0ACC2I4L7_9PLEO|nr:hypothetical protein OPT61_g6869 [Boeremia exigua]